jgi:hypothetical protein
MKISQIISEAEPATEIIKETAVKPYEIEFRDWSSDKAVEILKNNCKDSLKLVKGRATLFRGTTNRGALLVIDPSTGVRKSTNTKNYYTILMDNSPYFREYPARSKSLICTTDEFYARDFNTLYVLVPFDGQKIGICPYSDIWFTTIRNLPLAGGEIYSFEDIDPYFSDFELSEKDVSERKIPDTLRSLCVDKGFNPDQFYNIIDQRISPERTGFELLSTAEFAANRSSLNRRECWVGGKVLLIRHDMLNEVIKKI